MAIQSFANMLNIVVSIAVLFALLELFFISSAMKKILKALKDSEAKRKAEHKELIEAIEGLYPVEEEE